MPGALVDWLQSKSTNSRSSLSTVLTQIVSDARDHEAHNLALGRWLKDNGPIPEPTPQELAVIDDELAISGDELEP